MFQPTVPPKSRKTFSRPGRAYAVPVLDRWAVRSGLGAGSDTGLQMSPDTHTSSALITAAPASETNLLPQCMVSVDFWVVDLA